MTFKNDNNAAKYKGVVKSNQLTQCELDNTPEMSGPKIEPNEIPNKTYPIFVVLDSSVLMSIIAAFAAEILPAVNPAIKRPINNKLTA